MKRKPALTLVELMLVMGLLLVLTVPFVISFTGFRNRLALKSAGENLSNMIRTARVNAREERLEQSWGIRYVDNKTYSMVNGSPTSFAVYRTYTLEQSIVFGSSFSDIWFEQSNGETAHDREIELLSANGLEGLVEISRVGIVKYSIN